MRFQLPSAIWAAPLLAIGLITLPAPGRTEQDLPLPPLEEQHRRLAVELTFLKSEPGQRENLVRFIESNWFAMDKIAVEQGLMRDYRVFDTGHDDGPWNVLVAVTYSNAEGYAGVIDAFERIRRAHNTVPIGGHAHLRELGTIVESKTTFTRDGGPSGDTASN
jgi:hypothetical protein